MQKVGRGCVSRTSPHFRVLAFGSAVLVLASGCAGFSGTQSATKTPNTPSVSTPSPGTAARKVVHLTATPVVIVDASYRAFVNSLCKEFRGGNADAIIGSLMYYQYNSGARFGFLGDGEGQTADPSIVRTWLRGAHVKCVSFSSGTRGHAVVLASGWTLPHGPASLVELDIVNGKWKINDFTFGGPDALKRAMLVAQPILPYRV